LNINKEHTLFYHTVKTLKNNGVIVKKKNMLNNKITKVFSETNSFFTSSEKGNFNPYCSYWDINYFRKHLCLQSVYPGIFFLMLFFIPLDRIFPSANCQTEFDSFFHFSERRQGKSSF